MYNYNKATLAAKQILKEIKDKNRKVTFPINPFELLKSHNAVITYSDFDKLEGLLLYDKKQSFVSINVHRPITRQRFTAAHELGHILMHAEIKENEFICPISGVKNDIEKEADAFASNLLMPTDELRKRVDYYADENGKVGLDECLLIAEYFGVSFESCVKTICFRIKRFVKDLNNDELNRLIKKYKPNEKRKKIFEKSDDLSLLINAIDYSHFSMINLNETIGIKFIQNLVYHDSRLEKIEITQEEVNGIFADLRINGSNSVYCKSKNRNIIEALGNIEMNKYCLKTKDEIDISKIKKLNKLLYKYAPFPGCAGSYRNTDNLIFGGTIQPVTYTQIFDRLNELNVTLKQLKENVEKYSISEYIEMVSRIHYELTIIHPFNDGNGRTTRAFTNWLLRLKGLCPIYIDSENRDEYIKALQEIDHSNKYDLLQIIIIKSMMKTMTEIYKSWQ